MLFFAKFIDRQLIFSNKKAVAEYFQSNKDYKGEYYIEIDKVKGKRSMNQNSFYWLYLGVIEKETGNLATDLHELFKRKFLPPIPKKILGVEFKIPASTTNLNKTEFSEYMDKICSLTGVPIPEVKKQEIDRKKLYENLERPEGEITAF